MLLKVNWRKSYAHHITIQFIILLFYILGFQYLKHHNFIIKMNIFEFLVFNKLVCQLKARTLCFHFVFGILLTIISMSIHRIFDIILLSHLGLNWKLSSISKTLCSSIVHLAEEGLLQFSSKFWVSYGETECRVGL